MIAILGALLEENDIDSEGSTSSPYLHLGPEISQETQWVFNLL
jgi:hypothetical protein